MPIDKVSAAARLYHMELRGEFLQQPDNDFVATQSSLCSDSPNCAVQHSTSDGCHPPELAETADRFGLWGNPSAPAESVSQAQCSRNVIIWTIDPKGNFVCIGCPMPRQRKTAVMERSAVDDITPFLPGDTVAYLRIADGDRRFPFRPIASGLFLIGHGRSCDLRLGNKDVPAIHSVVQINAKSAEITRVGATPELVVNGEEVDRCTLNHGDIIEIGDVRCMFAKCHPETLAADVKLASSTLDQPTLTKPSTQATDLIDRIETEFLMIDSQDSSRDRVRELLSAAQKAVESCAFTETIRLDDYKAQRKAIESSDSAMDAIVVTHMKAQQSRLDEICGVLEQVVHQQQLIASALQCLAEQIDAMRVNPAATNLRASA